MNNNSIQSQWNKTKQVKKELNKTLNVTKTAFPILHL